MSTASAGAAQLSLPILSSKESTTAEGEEPPNPDRDEPPSLSPPASSARHPAVFALHTRVRPGLRYRRPVLRLAEDDVGLASGGLCVSDAGG